MSKVSGNRPTRNGYTLGVAGRQQQGRTSGRHSVQGLNNAAKAFSQTASQLNAKKTGSAGTSRATSDDMDTSGINPTLLKAAKTITIIALANPIGYAAGLGARLLTKNHVALQLPSSLSLLKTLHEKAEKLLKEGKEELMDENTSRFDKALLVTSFIATQVLTLPLSSIIVGYESANFAIVTKKKIYALEHPEQAVARGAKNVAREVGDKEKRVLVSARKKINKTSNQVTGALNRAGEGVFSIKAPQIKGKNTSDKMESITGRVKENWKLFTAFIDRISGSEKDKDE